MLSTKSGGMSITLNDWNEHRDPSHSNESEESLHIVVDPFHNKKQKETL